MTTLRARALFAPVERVLHNLLSRRRICVETGITPPLSAYLKVGKTNPSPRRMTVSYTHLTLPTKA